MRLRPRLPLSLGMRDWLTPFLHPGPFFLCSIKRMSHLTSICPKFMGRWLYLSLAIISEVIMPSAATRDSLIFFIHNCRDWLLAFYFWRPLPHNTCGDCLRYLVGCWYSWHRSRVLHFVWTEIVQGTCWYGFNYCRNPRDETIQ